MKDRNRWMLLAAVATIAGLIYALQPILLPFVVGALFAYLGNPLVHRLMRLGCSRVMAVSATFATLCLAGTATLVLVLPRLWEQLVYLESRIPSVLRWMNRQGIPWLENKFHVNIDRIDMDLITEWLTAFWRGADATTTDPFSYPGTGYTVVNNSASSSAVRSWAALLLGHCDSRALPEALRLLKKTPAIAFVRPHCQRPRSARSSARRSTCNSAFTASISFATSPAISARTRTLPIRKTAI